MPEIELFHGTSHQTYTKILKEGLLWGVPKGDETLRHTYLAYKQKTAEEYGKVILSVKIPEEHIYVNDDWQAITYRPIPIENTRVIEEKASLFADVQPSAKQLHSTIPKRTQKLIHCPMCGLGETSRARLLIHVQQQHHAILSQYQQAVLKSLRHKIKVSNQQFNNAMKELYREAARYKRLCE